MSVLIWSGASLFLLVSVGALIIYARDWGNVIDLHGNGSGAYDLRPDRERKMRLKGGSFEVENPDGCTWLLAIRVRASLLGRISPPKIEIRCGTTVSYQYVGLGKEGRVLINLAGLGEASEEQVSVRLSCKRGRLDDTGTLLGFEDVPLEGRSILVIAPHPDDAEIAAFGLYSRNSPNTSIVNVTAGDQGQYPFGEPTQDERGTTRDPLKGDVRVWDSVTVPSLGGVPYDRCYNLGYLDGSLDAFAGVQEEASEKELSGRKRYRRMHSLGAQGLTFGEESLIEDLARILERETPDYVVLPHPELDCYSEHQKTTEAVIQAVRKVEEPPSHFFFYVVHNAVSNLYPYGPPHGLITLPPVDEEPPSFAGRPLSYSLSESEVVKKQYALEAMHELRRLDFPSHDGSVLVAEAARTIFGGIKRLLEVPSETTSNPQMRARAARPNEIFFVEPVQNVMEVYGQDDE